MKATPRFVRRLREETRLSIDQDLEALILKRFGTEPYTHTYTEQDLFEPVRKLVIDYNGEHRQVPPEELFAHPEDPKGGQPIGARPAQQAFR